MLAGSAVAALTAGTAISITGTLANYTIAHADTSTVGDTANSGGTVMQNFTFDGFGHVATQSSVNLDTRYAQALTQGSGISITGALSGYTIAHSDTSGVTSADNSGTTFIQDLTFDTYGHVTAIASVDAATALDSRYVNTTGDTMTGNLVVDIDAIGTSGYIGLKTNASLNHQWQFFATAHDYAVIPEDFFLAYYNGSTLATAIWIENSTMATQFGGTLSSTNWNITTAGVMSMAANSDTTHTLGRAVIGYSAASDSATFAHYDQNTSTNFGFAQYANGASQVNATTGQEITLSVNDVATYTVNADRLLPRSSVQVDLGDYNRKIRTIHAAELAVQTLIAQDVIATVGGQIIVSPTSRLIADISSAGVPGGTDVIYTNLISYWSLDEVGGTRLDSKSTNHLSDKNTVTSTTGKVGVSALFNLANSERLWCADNAALSTGDIQFYICAWVYATLDDGGTQCVLAKAGASGDRSWTLHVNWSTNKFDFTVYSAANAATTISTGTISTNTWYFVECWHDSSGNTINIALNRTETSSAYSAGVKDDTGNFTIGARSTGVYFTGRVDEVGFWKNYIPDSTRRNWLYNSGSGRAYTDIYNYGAGAFEMDIEHNSYGAGDFLYMAAAPGGIAQHEVFKITSSPTTITGGYRYSAERDLDGTGANNWYAGDAVTSLGGPLVRATST
jgi:hypothetical protein